MKTKVRLSISIDSRIIRENRERPNWGKFELLNPLIMVLNMWVLGFGKWAKRRRAYEKSPVAERAEKARRRLKGNWSLMRPVMVIWA